MSDTKEGGSNELLPCRSCEQCDQLEIRRGATTVDEPRYAVVCHRCLYQSPAYASAARAAAAWNHCAPATLVDKNQPRVLKRAYLYGALRPVINDAFKRARSTVGIYGTPLPDDRPFFDGIVGIMSREFGVAIEGEPNCAPTTPLAAGAMNVDDCATVVSMIDVALSKQEHGGVNVPLTVREAQALRALLLANHHASKALGSSPDETPKVESYVPLSSSARTTVPASPVDENERERSSVFGAYLVHWDAGGKIGVWAYPSLPEAESAQRNINERHDGRILSEVVVPVAALRSHPVATDQVMPGSFECGVCGLVMQATNMNARDGSMTAAASPQECPNRCGTMVPLTYKKAFRDLLDRTTPPVATDADATERRCCKCGGTDLSIRFVQSGTITPKEVWHSPLVVQRKDEPWAREWGEDVLAIACRTCRYQWGEKPLDVARQHTTHSTGDSA